MTGPAIFNLKFLARKKSENGRKTPIRFFGPMPGVTFSG